MVEEGMEGMTVDPLVVAMIIVVMVGGATVVMTIGAMEVGEEEVIVVMGEGASHVIGGIGS